MRGLLTTKGNKLLIFLLLLDLTAIGVLSDKFLNEKDAITMIDFSDYTKTEVENWLSENNYDMENYNYTYAYDDEVKKKSLNISIS